MLARLFVPFDYPSAERESVRGPGGYSPTVPIRVCAAQRGRDFGTPDLERGIHYRDVS